MQEETLSLYRWRVKPGNEEVFIEAWLAFADYLAGTPYASSEHVLVQSVDDPQRFDSFGPWPTPTAYHAMRADPEAGRLLQGLADLCEEATPGLFQIVARSRHALGEDRLRNLRRAS